MTEIIVNNEQNLYKNNILNPKEIIITQQQYCHAVLFKTSVIFKTEKFKTPVVKLQRDALVSEQRLQKEN